MIDNNVMDHYPYLLTIITGLRKDAGTTSRVGVSISGAYMQTENRLLNDGFIKVRPS